MAKRLLPGASVTESLQPTDLKSWFPGQGPESRYRSAARVSFSRLSRVQTNISSSLFAEEVAGDLLPSLSRRACGLVLLGSLPSVRELFVNGDRNTYLCF